MVDYNENVEKNRDELEYYLGKELTDELSEAASGGFMSDDFEEVACEIADYVRLTDGYNSNKGKLKKAYEAIRNKFK